ncbi:hypothetical protein EZV62_024578 [Acer yangbiense]|uniref:NADH dehydrogenase [ubiquinone] 1 alpha subcomplex subunit 12 n=1 Tax=Acer yangbiense TaxID=1000413 RepID=A0A5C7GVH5_9ROSI|nr:hypothetical protein EZV62_024578 [Acer yangbiense]
MKKKKKNYKEEKQRRERERERERDGVDSGEERIEGDQRERSGYLLARAQRRRLLLTHCNYVFIMFFRRCLPDGNLLQTKLHNIGAKLVGVDKFGNKYYEKLGNTQYGRHRWVEYAEKSRYNASQVPAEWHGWLHFITDHTGDEASPILKYYLISCLLMLKPKRYGIEHKENLSGEGDEYIYHSKGHTLNPGQRDWSRYQPWQPTKAE